MENRGRGGSNRGRYITPSRGTTGTPRTTRMQLANQSVESNSSATFHNDAHTIRPSTPRPAPYSTSIENRISSMEQTVDTKLTSILNTLNRLENALLLQQKDMFDISKAKYIGSITKEVLTKFCTDLRRKPSQDEISAILTKFMGKDAEDSDKFEAGLAFCRTKLNRARGEERRKLLAKASTKCLSTDILAEQILNGFKVDTRKHKSTYVKHLALLRKFARESTPQTTFYEDFRTWLNKNYSSDDAIEWQTIMEEDAQIEYDYYDDSTDEQTGMEISEVNSLVDAADNS